MVSSFQFHSCSNPSPPHSFLHGGVDFAGKKKVFAGRKKKEDVE